MTASEPGTRPLRVGLANPFCWPWVRRGSERMLDLMSNGLSTAGHEVTVYASAPEAGLQQRGAVAYRLLPQQALLDRRQLGAPHAHAWHLSRALRHAGLDVVWCLSHFDAWAALQARARGARHRVIFHSMGIPTRRYFRAVPLDAWFMHTALERADAVCTLSRFAATTLATDFACTATVLPGLVGEEAFVHGEPPVPPPALLFVGDADEPRKGAELLCLAFARLQPRHPGLRLVFSGAASAARRARLLALPGMSGLAAQVHFAGLGATQDLPALFASARVTVLPAVWEAFGLVLLESLAAGTPVVAARHAGIPDIVDGSDPGLGDLFEPLAQGAAATPGLTADNLDGLVAALDRQLARPDSAADRARRREHARDCTWQRLAPRYEALLRPTAGGPP